MNDLYLAYQFTDSHGAMVYNVHPADDRLALENPLFEIRLKNNSLGNPETEVTWVSVIDTWNPAEPYPDEPGFKEVTGHGTG
jgi:hypothetical protein